MANAAHSISNEVVDLKLWKKNTLLPAKRTDSERLIERGKSCLLEIRQTPGTRPEALQGRIFQRLITVLKILYPSQQNTREVIAWHISKSFHALLKEPDSYFGFFDLFDIVVCNSKDIFNKKHSADGCLLSGGLYLTPPWVVFEPTLAEFYAHYSSRLYRELHECRCNGLAIEALSDERHIKKAMLAVADLFLHPSKI